MDKKSLQSLDIRNAQTIEVHEPLGFKFPAILSLKGKYFQFSHFISGGDDGLTAIYLPAIPLRNAESEQVSAAIKYKNGPISIVLSTPITELPEQLEFAGYVYTRGEVTFIRGEKSI